MRTENEVIQTVLDVAGKDDSVRAGHPVDQITCNVCPHACKLKAGEIGACGARGYFPDEGFVKEISGDHRIRIN